MSVADLAIVAVLVFGWGTLSARLERFDVTAPITFVLAGLLLTHWPLAFLSVTPSKELIKTLRSVRDFARKEWPLRGSPADARCA